MVTIQVTPSHIRKVNIRQDLLAVADLIEICFSSTLDDDGREYLRHLRWTARDLNYLSWLQGAAERVAAPLYGFVWEENNRVVGNLSLIPINRMGQFTYLIANVAVHPDYRRHGIGRQLTQTALDHLQHRGVSVAWLQVREDNPAAIHLYRTLGFVDRSRRATWMSSSRAPLPLSQPTGVTVQQRRIQDWTLQETWLQDIYPADVRWNLPLSLMGLSPSPWNQLLRWLRSEPQQHWAARLGSEPVGFVSWVPMRGSSDPLWLATNPKYEDLAIQALLPTLRYQISGRKPLSVNYPADRAADAFIQAGYYHHQTLIWMSVELEKR